MSLTSVFRVEIEGSTIVMTPLQDPDELSFDALLEDDCQNIFDLLGSGEAKNVLIDCHNIDRCCSSAVAFFIKLWKRTQACDGRLVYCSVSPHLREVFEIVRLDKVWPMFESRAEAIAELQESV